MSIGLLEIGGFIVCVAFAIVLIFGARLLNTLNKTVVSTTETIELAKVTLEETNGILKNVNEVTEDVSGTVKEAKKLVDSTKGIIQSLEGSFSVVKNVGSLLGKFKK